MSDIRQIPLTYRGVLGHRGVQISGDTYGKVWTLRLADGMWVLADHQGDEVHSFEQKELHRKVAFPGFSRGYPDLYLVGLGPRVYCFQPEREVVDALKLHVERSERANAPQLARWHRGVGLGFLGLSVLLIAGCAAGLSWALRGDDASGSWRLGVTLAAILPGLGTGAYFGVVGIRDVRKGNRFAGITAV